MIDFYIGLITTVAVIAILEVFRFLEKRLMGTLILVGIAFIYIGFTWQDKPSLFLSIGSGAVFFALAYFGYKKNYLLVVSGLLLHGVWDMSFPFFSDAAPSGYDIFCITIDLLLAIYFYFRVKPAKIAMR